jgi:arylsulfatase A
MMKIDVINYLSLVSVFGFVSLQAQQQKTKKPNVILILTDDSGYADLSSYGSVKNSTPNLDKLGAEGVRFTDFYVAQGKSTASRAALLTGCYPERVGMTGAINHRSNYGISSSEELIPELLREAGYKTAMLGKWHLGHHPQFLPCNHGFDSFFGTPYSNDMWEHHPHQERAKFPRLPLIGNDSVIKYITPQDQEMMTTWYTERAVDFISNNRDQNFFLYYAPNMPHTPLFVSDKFKGKSGKGLYADVIMELDWSVGEIVKALKNNNIYDNTLIIYLSDNGPNLNYGNHGGEKGVFREGKGTTFDGGAKIHCIMRWGEVIQPTGDSDIMGMSIDILPTIVEACGAKLPQKKIDGVSMMPVLTGKRNKPIQDHYVFFWDYKVEAVRKGHWKFHFSHTYLHIDPNLTGKDGQPGTEQWLQLEESLYNLKKDPSESVNLLRKHPRIGKKLRKIGEKAQKEMDENRRTPEFLNNTK